MTIEARPARAGVARFHFSIARDMATLMNRFERPTPIGTEAHIDYLDADYRIIRHGSFVTCAVTREPIPLAELRYWSVALQEAYASPEAVLIRQKQLMGRAAPKSGA